jgi:Protein of unknown function (DUF998)
MAIAGRVKGDTNARDAGAATLTRALLACGVVSGPFFYVVAVGQILTRPGFDIRRHPISALSLGDQGWIQIANFVITGVLAVACAVGVRRLLRHSRAGTWGPVLIGAYGVGMIMAGILHPDPSLGFPPGAPAGMPATMSTHATVHTIAFFVAFLSLVVACFLFSRRFFSLGHRGWGIYCAATGVAAPLLIVLGSSISAWVGVIIAVTGMVAFGWVSVVAARLSADLSRI